MSTGLKIYLILGGTLVLFLAGLAWFMLAGVKEVKYWADRERQETAGYKLAFLAVLFGCFFMVSGALIWWLT